MFPGCGWSGPASDWNTNPNLLASLHPDIFYFTQVNDGPLWNRKSNENQKNPIKQTVCAARSDKVMSFEEFETAARTHISTLEWSLKGKRCSDFIQQPYMASKTPARPFVNTHPFEWTTCHLRTVPARDLNIKINYLREANHGPHALFQSDSANSLTNVANWGQVLHKCRGTHQQN